jgi:hypothetical protein
MLDQRKQPLKLTAMPSSFIMYPMPKPLPTVGPNPNKRRAGLPQLLVLITVWFIIAHPASVKILGVFSSLCSLSHRQLSAYRWRSWPKPFEHSRVSFECLLMAFRSASSTPRLSPSLSENIFTKSATSGVTVRMASVRPCKKVFVIATNNEKNDQHIAMYHAKQKQSGIHLVRRCIQFCRTNHSKRLGKPSKRSNMTRSAYIRRV